VTAATADVAKAARLVSYALNPKTRPVPDSDYRALLARYQTDDGFRELVETVAENLALHVRAATPLGLVVAGDLDGPFAVNLDNCGLPIRPERDNRRLDRLCFALLLVALAAFAYPHGENLVDTSTPTVRPEELERFVTAHARAARSNADGVSDEIEISLSDAITEWLDLPEVLPHARGGYRQGCRRYYVTKLLSFLVDNGRARREPALSDASGDAFVLNDRFRIGLAETAETLLAQGFVAATGDPDFNNRSDSGGSSLLSHHTAKGSSERRSRDGVTDRDGGEA
jgi:hypothetical protein